MGVVYKAHDKKLDRVVALKFLPPGLVNEPQRKERFLREARAASALDHANVCTIYGIEEHGDRLFIVMGCYDGESLAERIGRGPLTIAEAVDYATQAARGLSKAHTKGIVHRDIKPHNLMITEDGVVKIVDFGIAKLSGVTALTQDGITLGTAAYMSPEQARGAEVDHRTDIWSLGAVLYEMIAGVPPFRADTAPSLLYCIVHEAPPPLVQAREDIPTWLADTVERAMMKDPDARFDSMEAMGAALQTAPAATVSADDAEVLVPLEQAQRALERYEWTDAFAAYQAADTAGTLSTEDTERLAEAAFWVGHIDVAMDAWQRAHARYVRSKRPTDAARVATRLAYENLGINALAVANGWLKRAENHLADLPDGIEHGFLARVQGRFATRNGDLDTAFAFARRARDIAERCDNADLRALGMLDHGRLLVIRDEVAKGFALIDEAMASATAGELSPQATGAAYCIMVSVCERLGDYRRAGEWSERSVHWCESHSDSPYPGICSVHRAQVMRARGEWGEAETQARHAADAHRSWLRVEAAEALYVLGELQLHRGQLEMADETFQQAHEYGRDPVPGLALLRLAQGETDAARSLIDSAIEESTHALARVRVLPAGVDIALAGGDIAKARARADELVELASRYESPIFSGGAAHASGAVALAEDRLEDSVTEFRGACARWKEASMPFEEARTRVLLARAYWAAKESSRAELEARTARATFERLGATTDLKRVETLIKQHG